MQPDRDQEFEGFKSGINLTAYAATMGYAPDKRSSGRNSFGMKNAAGDKIIVHRLADGHWYYWSVHSEQRGSIIDFVQHLLGLNYGEVRRELRPWLSGARTGPTEPGSWVDDLEPIHRDLGAVRAAWAAMEPLPFGQHDYLNQTRGLSASLLALPFLEDRIRSDARGNAAFPHYTREGISGFELKNAGFTGFAKHGKKGLWGSRIGPDDDRLAIAETAIDALSYAQQNGPSRLRLVSTGGATNPDQPDLIRSAISKLPSGEVIIAVDNDDGGDYLAGIIRTAFEAANNPAVYLREHRPPTRGQDWNDIVNAVSPSLDGQPFSPCPRQP